MIIVVLLLFFLRLIGVQYLCLHDKILTSSLIDRDGAYYYPVSL